MNKISLRMIVGLAVLMLLFASCRLPFSMPAFTITETQTPTQPPTQTKTSTSTPTETPTPTSTVTPTPTVYPLSLESVLDEIALQRDDLITFYQQVGIPTDGFVDGSIMVISPSEYSSLLSFSTWESFLERPVDLPSDLVNFHWKGFVTERDFEDGRIPLYLAAHTSTILVFEDPDQAHDFFINDIESMDKGFKLDMPTIGDESIAFSGWLGGYSPIGGVIWRYKEVYVSFTAQLKFEVTPESLITISQNIQQRLEAALE